MSCRLGQNRDHAIEGLSIAAIAQLASAVTAPTTDRTVFFERTGMLQAKGERHHLTTSSNGDNRRHRIGQLPMPQLPAITAAPALDTPL